MDSGQDWSAGKRKALLDLRRGRPQKFRRALDFSSEGQGSSEHVQQQVPAVSAGSMGQSGNNDANGRSPSAFVMGEGGVGRSEGSLEDLLSVFVPGASTVVNLSWQFLLDEICKKLGVGWAVSSVGDGPGILYSAWIEVEVPDALDFSVKKRRVFFGDEGLFDFEAKENAAEKAVSFFCKERGIIIKDANYCKVKELSERLGRAEFYVRAYSDKIEELSGNGDAMHQRFRAAISSIRDLCLESKSFIPVTSIDVLASENGPVLRKLLYSGKTPPKNDVEKYAFKLVSVMNRAMDLCALRWK